MSIKRLRKYKKIPLKKQYNALIALTLLLIIPIICFFIYYIVNKPTGNENITTKLTVEQDFLNWFTDFDKLYNQEVKTPTYSLTKNEFKVINNLINNSKNTNSIYLKDNIYYIDDDITLELDVNTRSLRYQKYSNEKIIEILEIRLLNGKYYVQLVKKNYLYKITFNHRNVKKKKIKSKEIIINDSIYHNKDFKW